MSEVGSFVLGFVIGGYLVLHGIMSIDERDVERGWSYLDGEKYFLTLDDDIPKGDTQ